MSVSETFLHLVEQGKEALARAQKAFHEREHELRTKPRAASDARSPAAERPPAYSGGPSDS